MNVILSNLGLFSFLSCLALVICKFPRIELKLLLKILFDFFGSLSIIATSWLDIGSIRGLLFFSALMLTVFRLKSISVHSKRITSPHLVPVYCSNVGKFVTFLTLLLTHPNLLLLEHRQIFIDNFILELSM